MRFLLPLALAFTLTAQGQTLPFLSDEEITALATEVSGESAKRNVEGLSRHHRMRGSRGFRAAAEQVVGELKRYGFDEARIESFPADGKIFYGTQRSRPAWNAELAELWEIDASGRRVVRLASWDAAPITLAQDSASGEVTAELIDVGAGTSDEAYAKAAGKIVLTSSQPGAIADRAVGRHRAAGIISYAQNQRTAWWGENENLIRWGHLETFSPVRTFAFMVSLKAARALQQRLARGETVRLHAKVIAGQEAGAYDIATAVIPGTDAAAEEIIYSCHLDHPRPGANDNASGCAAILEAARTLSKLIAEKRLARPRRTIRFVWPPEIEGTLALLNGRPELAARIKAAIHLDMVGGGPETKAIFHITRGPASAPSFVYDVAESIAEVVNDQTAQFAKTGAARWPLVAQDGGKEALRAELAPFSEGRDHQVYTDSSFGIPAIYLNDWPDRYIHTNFDVPANIDSTKLARAAFIAAASGYALARIGENDAPALHRLIERRGLARVSQALRRDDANAARFALWYERGVADSLGRFVTVTPAMRARSDRFLTRVESLLGDPAPAPRTGPVYARNPSIKGTMSAFGYDYFADKYTGPPVRLAGEYRYETLNLVDGRRTTSEIRDALAAIHGPVALEQVEEYLRALASIDVVRLVSAPPPAASAPSAPRSRASRGSAPSTRGRTSRSTPR